MNLSSFYMGTEIVDLASPKDQIGLSMESSALEFFTDFTKSEPLVIDSSATALEVKSQMQKEHVWMKLVLNEQGHFIGIITADDLADRVIVQKISEGFKREEILVTELMVPKRALKALDYSQVSRANIADVVAVLKDSGQQHCLVVDKGEVRGVFSARDLSKKLHLPITIVDKSMFLKVFSATA